MQKQRHRLAEFSAFVYSLRKYNSSSIYIQNFKLLAFSCDFTGQFMPDLVRNPEGQFSHDVAESGRFNPSVQALNVCL